MLTRPAMWGRRAFGLLVGLVVIVLAAPGTAFAHAELVNTDPAAGSVLATSPRSITLEFSEAVEISLGGVRLFAGNGREVAIGQTYHPDGIASAVRVDVSTLDDGSYVVDWDVVSADSHPIHGAFSFQVGSRSDLEDGILDEILGRDRTGRPAAVALTISRGLVTMAIALVFGGLVMLGFDVIAITARRRQVIVIAAIAGTVIGLLQLPLEVGYATGESLAVVFDADAWAAALDTRIGVAWLIRALVIGCVGVGLTVLLGQRASWWWRLALGLGLAGVGLASALSGHGATGRWETVGILATVVHVGSMAIWLGGLVMIVMSVRSIRADSLRSFSRIAVVAIGCVVASGVVQTLRQVDSVDALTSTSYGTLLIWKLVLVGVLVGVAALSRRVLHREHLDRPRQARLVGIEVALAIAIVGVTALLMGANPSQADSSQPFSANIVDGAYLVSITVDPARVGRNEIHIYLSNAESSLIEPDDVTVQISDPSRDVAPIDLTVERTGASHYTATDAVFPYAASWELEISARYNDFDQVNFTTTVPIR